ncbi:hypothetical protein ABID21_004174 [Pseudorhizobium tarimense]|uniref:Uncharacterized protein n=1 Tax=Pseudorhizobium tarimense TaxID=1079109 RepID=A0ABV2HBY0_9HYPH
MLRAKSIQSMKPRLQGSLMLDRLEVNAIALLARLEVNAIALLAQGAPTQARMQRAYQSFGIERHLIIGYAKAGVTGCTVS